MDPMKMLKEDHDRVEDLFRQVEKADDKQKLTLFKTIQQELELHTRLEEQIFYPACQQYEALKDLVLESLEEHKQVKTLLREIDRLSSGSERVNAKLTVLQENVEHHVEEEEGELFPRVRKLMSREELARLGDEIARLKGQASVPSEGMR